MTEFLLSLLFASQVLTLIVGSIFLNLGALGLLLAPFAGLICGFVARRRGLRFALYAILGAAGCVFLVFPFVCLLLRLTDKEMPRALTGPVYTALYVVWALTLVVLLDTLVISYIERETARVAVLAFGAIASLGLLVFSLKTRAWRTQALLNETSLKQVGFRTSMTLLLRDAFVHAWLGYLVSSLWILSGIIL